MHRGPGARIRATPRSFARHKGMTVTRPAGSEAIRAAALDGADLVGDLYDRYAGELYGYLVSACGSRDSAEDLLQETFLRLIREVRAGRAPREPRPWLYRVSGNLAASRGRRLSVLLGRVLRRIPTADPVPPPEERLLGREACDEIKTALSRMAPDARQVLLLAGQGLTGPEIAQSIGRSELATRSLLCRSRRALRRLLAQEEAIR